MSEAVGARKKKKKTQKREPTPSENENSSKHTLTCRRTISSNAHSRRLRHKLSFEKSRKQKTKSQNNTSANIDRQERSQRNKDDTQHTPLTRAPLSTTTHNNNEWSVTTNSPTHPYKKIKSAHTHTHAVLHSHTHKTIENAESTLLSLSLSSNIDLLRQPQTANTSVL